MSLSGSVFVVAMLLIASWWSFWGAIGATVRVRAGATTRLGFGLGLMGPVGVALAALSVSQRTPAQFPTYEPPLLEASVEPMTSDLPPLPD